MLLRWQYTYWRCEGISLIREAVAQVQVQVRAHLSQISISELQDGESRELLRELPTSSIIAMSKGQWAIATNGEWKSGLDVPIARKKNAGGSGIVLAIQARSPKCQIWYKPGSAASAC